MLAPMAAQVLLDTLGLGNREVFGFLNGARPGYAEFRQWIADTVGAPDAELLARYVRWVAGEEECHPDDWPRLAQIAAMAPVLDEAALSHWEARGYVVLPGAITAQEVAAVRALIWQDLRASPDDPDSWYLADVDGIMIDRYRHAALEVARRSARTHKAFAQLWGTENLWATIDRVGFNPPERAESRFRGSPLHWDVSLVQPVPFGTQGVLYLTDTSADGGAFRCVPGFHRRLASWLDGLGAEDPRAVDLSAQAHAVPGKAGDLVIWRHELPHGASPNRAATPRLVQYLNFYSPDMPVQEAWR